MKADINSINYSPSSSGVTFCISAFVGSFMTSEMVMELRKRRWLI